MDAWTKKLAEREPEAASEIDRLEKENSKLRRALVETRQDFQGHFDDNCEDCRSAIARIDKALGRK